MVWNCCYFANQYFRVQYSVKFNASVKDAVCNIPVNIMMMKNIHVQDVEELTNLYSNAGIEQ